jgi:hypothetical protein
VNVLLFCETLEPQKKEATEAITSERASIGERLTRFAKRASGTNQPLKAIHQMNFTTLFQL